jgi:predicted O-methyltransferase YrrM
MDEATLERWAKQALAEEPYPDPRFPPSPYYRFLKILAQNLQPRLSVELGVSGGGGSFHLAIGWPQGKVIGVDLAYDHPQNINYIFGRCPNFEFWQGDSVKSAGKIYQEHGPVDLLFIDTVHEYGQAWAELEAYRPYLSEQAVICLDDLFRPEMIVTDFWGSLPGPKVRIDQLHDGAESGGGFGIIWNFGRE